MKQSEYALLGQKDAAEIWAARYAGNEFYARMEENEFRTGIASPEASDAAVQRKTTSSAFIEGFKNTFVRLKRESYWSLPSVRAEMRTRAVTRWIDCALESAESTLAKFVVDLEKDPAYAFEWADGAVQAAAEKFVATALKQIVSGEHVPEEKRAEYDGISESIKFATREAMSGARYPSRSTGQVRNLVQQSKTAAYAQFAEDMRAYETF